jgi:hypothetical protein
MARDLDYGGVPFQELKEKFSGMAVTYDCSQEFTHSAMISDAHAIRTLAEAIVDKSLQDLSKLSARVGVLTVYANLLRPTCTVKIFASKRADFIKWVRANPDKAPTKSKLLSLKPIESQLGKPRTYPWHEAGFCDACDIAWNHFSGRDAVQGFYKLGLHHAHFDMPSHIGKCSVYRTHVGRPTPPPVFEAPSSPPNEKMAVALSNATSDSEPAEETVEPPRKVKAKRRRSKQRVKRPLPEDDDPKEEEHVPRSPIHGLSPRESEVEYNPHSDNDAAPKRSAKRKLDYPEYPVEVDFDSADMSQAVHESLISAGIDAVLNLWN